MYGYTLMMELCIMYTCYIHVCINWQIIVFTQWFRYSKLLKRISINLIDSWLQLAFMAYWLFLFYFIGFLLFAQPKEKKMLIMIQCVKYARIRVFSGPYFPVNLRFCPYTFFNIDEINEARKKLCYKNNFVFVDHQNITSYDLWADDIHLTNSGKAILARDFAVKLNKFLGRNCNFQRSFIRQILQIPQMS